MYRFILDEEAVFAFARFEPDDQLALLRAFEELGRHLVYSGLASFRDREGRENFIFRADAFLLTLRFDHAVKEVRVVDLGRI